MLRPTGGGADVLVDIDVSIGDRTDSFGSEGIRADLPGGVAAGRYHAFLRVFVDGRPSGDGLGCDVVVPGA